MISRTQKYHSNHKKTNNDALGKCILGIFGIILAILIVIDNAKHLQIDSPVMTTEHALITPVLGGLLLLVFQYGMLKVYGRSQLVASVNSIVRHLSNKFVMWIIAYILIVLCFLIYPLTLWALISFLAILIFYLLYPHSISITRKTFGYDWKHMEYLRQHKFNGFGIVFKIVGIGMVVFACLILLSAVLSFTGTILIYCIGALFIVALIIFAFVFIMGNF